MHAGQDAAEVALLGRELVDVEAEGGDATPDATLLLAACAKEMEVPAPTAVEPASGDLLMGLLLMPMTGA